MNKILLIILLAFSISAFGITLSYAASVDADVIEGDHCVVSQDASGVNVPLMTFDTYRIAGNKNNVRAVCKFTIPPEGNEPKKTLTNKDLNCRITTADGTSMMADDAHVVVTPGGQAVLTCKYKTNS